MEYISTRGDPTKHSFIEVLLSGLANDGGLYLPSTWPFFSNKELLQMKKLSYPELAFSIMTPFIGEGLKNNDLKLILQKAYSYRNFEQIAPLKKISKSEYLLELFHGPTLAFKDLAMQFLGPLFEHVLKTRGNRVVIIGATSGDTGSAAIEACKGRESIEIFILYPNGRISEIQRRQMTTIATENVNCIAIDGTFDNCQDIVKSIFNDHHFSTQNSLIAINSINWARIMAQIVYYFWAALKFDLHKDPISFTVPTGNFGNVLSGYLAKKIGLPINQLIVGSNRNDILTRFLKTGVMKIEEVHATISPSMDIQISSNFERLLFLLYDGDGFQVRKLMSQLRNSGNFNIDSEHFRCLKELFDGASFDDSQTCAMIKKIHQEAKILIDPHTAVGVAAARSKCNDNTIPMISLATAHPAKFPKTVEDASGIKPSLPAQLKNLAHHKELFTSLPNDTDLIKAFIDKKLSTLQNK